MSKTFKTTTTTGRILKVEDTGEGVYLSIHDESEREFLNINIARSDAPALALAILEAAGWPEEAKTSVTHTIMADLRAVIATQERATAEAKEQAELEAEALELWASLPGVPEDQYTFADLNEHTQRDWLAVARKAREMRAEK